MKTIAIVGRTNVGKSTLFNRLCHKKLAIVHNKPGVTRDRKEAIGYLGNCSFRVIDTAGLENGGELEKKMWLQTQKAIDEADIILMMTDARAGIHPLDEELAHELHKIEKKVFLIANKCEGKAQEELIYDLYKLGLGDPIPFSAEHGRGIGLLTELVLPLVKKSNKETLKDETESNDNEEEIIEEKEKPIRLAIVGRPNVGKSTLINKFIKQERLLTGPMAGVTRDSIEVPFSWDKNPVVLIDTAGLRKHANITDSLEKIAGSQTSNAIDFATVVVLVLDATQPMERQDIAIAVKVFEEGRPLIIALNKWDLAKDPNKIIKSIEQKLASSLQQVKGIPVIPISGKTGFGLSKLMSLVSEVYKKWNKRIPTHKMNLFLKEMTEKHLPPIAKNGRRIPLKYMTQTNTRPPFFIIFSSNPQELPDSYIRYLTNGIRTHFGFEGIPIRLSLRKQKNPYAK